MCTLNELTKRYDIIDRRNAESQMRRCRGVLFVAVRHLRCIDEATCDSLLSKLQFFTHAIFFVQFEYE